MDTGRHVRAIVGLNPATINYVCVCSKTPLQVGTLRFSSKQVRASEGRDARIGHINIRKLRVRTSRRRVCASAQVVEPRVLVLQHSDLEPIKSN